MSWESKQHPYYFTTPLSRLCLPLKRLYCFYFFSFSSSFQPRTRRGRSLVHAATESFGSERNSKGQQVLQAVLVAAVSVAPAPRILDFQAAEKTFSVRARADSGACSTPRKDARCVSKAVAFAEPWPPNAKECEAWTALRGRHYSLRRMLRARLRKPRTLCNAPSLPDDPVVAGAHARLPPVRCNSRGPISFPFFVFS